MALTLGAETDRLALFALKDQLTDGISGALSSWNDSLHFCEWQGVSCGKRHQRVTALALNNLKLAGYISPSISNLTFLSKIELSKNKLRGNIPSEFGRLRRLQFLNLTSNKLQGEIPVELANCSNLQVLILTRNNLTGSVPNTLGKLKNLQLLNVGYNSLGSGKTGDLSFLSSLTNCSHLESLAMNVNTFGGKLPQSVANLSTQIRELYMGRNQISGSIPEGMGRSVPLTLRNCTNLQNLYLGENNLSGNIPDQVFGFCESLIVVNISYNISYNSFNGPLPSDFGNLKNLIVLIVSENKFSGEIPASLGECSELSILDLAGNLFQGSIPLSLGSLKSLEMLNLSRNSLSGTIPQQLQNLSFLKSLNLSFNHLEGEVPTGGVFKDVNAFSILGNNKLCGGVPEIRLPLCPNQEPRKKLHSLSTKATIAIVLCVLLSTTIVVVLLILCWRRTYGKQLGPTSILGGSFLQISYKELLQATDNFASHNLIGAGSSGTVYKGSIQQLEKPVAIKVLNLQNRGASKSFMAECKVLSKVRHRNLLKIITSCSSLDHKGNDFKALVFEFMPNGSLERWLHTTEQSGLRNLNLMQRLDIAIDVAYALDYLHHHCETAIVHCDLKSTNILLDDDMVAHVGDFGLAKLLSGASVNFSRDQTTSSGVKGTIGYVPPEYGMGAIVSPEGDVYSYGILLLEMITGKRPTDEMFNEGLSLHEFCKMALPERVRDIVDSDLLGLLDENISNVRNGRLVEGKMLECLVSFCRIGVACSAELPGERMNIEDVISELQATKTRMLQAAIQGGNIN
ncbi:receptor kinase-like protein Xa21 [Pistacia vera]|uniref:receptor kinase-like protein Xa21 n=1 Tax=Pistacia vera TaxID=55513 RepID=UPI001262FBFD|nr:receptor kinase-like protein Xa21 [Pistacia vera]